MHDYNYRGSYYAYKGNCARTDPQLHRDRARRRCATSFTAYLNFDRTFKRHQTGVTAGYDYMAERYRNLTANATGAVGRCACARLGCNFTASNRTEAGDDLLFRAGIVQFDNRYIVSGTARADGSSKFAVGNQWGYFPLVPSHGTSRTRTVLAHAETANTFKLRASYGQTGNNGIGLYDAYGAYSTGAELRRPLDDDRLGDGQRALQLGDYHAVRLGFDLGMFQNRLRIVADYYNKRTDNMIFSISVPDTSAPTRRSRRTWAAPGSTAWKSSLVR